jgi:hypothetical protein
VVLSRAGALLLPSVIPAPVSVESSGREQSSCALSSGELSTWEVLCCIVPLSCEPSCRVPIGCVLLGAESDSREMLSGNSSSSASMIAAAAFCMRAAFDGLCVWREYAISTGCVGARRRHECS